MHLFRRIKIQKAVGQDLLQASGDNSLIHLKNESQTHPIVQLLTPFHFLKATEKEIAYSSKNRKRLETLVILKKIAKTPSVTYIHSHNFNKYYIPSSFKIISLKIINKNSI